MNNEDNKAKKNDLRQYRILGLTLLQLMTLVAILGIVVTITVGWILS